MLTLVKKKISLKEAQENKYKQISKIVDLAKDDNVLEIGCGWGGFAEYAAKNYKSIITAITISKEQFEFTKQRINNAKLSKLVNTRLIDYRKVKGSFDRIISIEMIEAVGEQYWPIYFKQIKNLLKPKGTAAIQVITIDDKFFDNYRKFPDFIQKYIFPGGFLPSLNYIEKLTKQNELKLETVNSYSNDYAKTLFTWKNNFLRTWDNISPLGFDVYFKRMWEFYLCYCEAGFKSKNIDLIQFSIQNK